MIGSSILVCVTLKGTRTNNFLHWVAVPFDWIAFANLEVEATNFDYNYKPTDEHSIECGKGN